METIPLTSYEENVTIWREIVLRFGAEFSILQTQKAQRVVLYWGRASSEVRASAMSSPGMDGPGR
jgi:hypothetical protein